MDSTTESRRDGCRPLTRVASVFLLFSAAGIAAGVYLISDEACTGLCEVAGLALYAAGGPVSGLFAALAGGLVLAWPVDITLWIVAAFGAMRLAAARSIPLTRVGGWIIAAALMWGVFVSSLLERA